MTIVLHVEDKSLCAKLQEGAKTYMLWLSDPAYFCEKFYLYIFVLFSFIWSDGDLSS